MLYSGDVYPLWPDPKQRRRLNNNNIKILNIVVNGEERAERRRRPRVHRATSTPRNRGVRVKNDKTKKLNNTRIIIILY